MTASRKTLAISLTSPASPRGLFLDALARSLRKPYGTPVAKWAWRDFQYAKNEAGFDAKTPKGSHAGVRSRWYVVIASEWCISGRRG